MSNTELFGSAINYEQVPPGSRLDTVLEGLDVRFALSALRHRPIAGDRQKQIVEMRFGLLDGNPKTQREIAGHFDRSVSVIARDEIEALVTMRRIRNEIRPEKVFPRNEIYSIDKGYLFPPHTLRKYGTKYPVHHPRYEYPQ